jgi:hypothetical protein
VSVPSASAALGCAVAMQLAVRRHNRQHARNLGLRVGLSGGDVTKEDGDYFGEPVVEAARLCARAGSGQILVADVVRIMAGLWFERALEVVDPELDRTPYLHLALALAEAATLSGQQERARTAARSAWDLARGGVDPAAAGRAALLFAGEPDSTSLETSPVPISSRQPWPTLRRKAASEPL